MYSIIANNKHLQSAPSRRECDALCLGEAMRFDRQLLRD